MKNINLTECLLIFTNFHRPKMLAAKRQSLISISSKDESKPRISEPTL